MRVSLLEVPALFYSAPLYGLHVFQIRIQRYGFQSGVGKMVARGKEKIPVFIFLKRVFPDEGSQYASPFSWGRQVAEKQIETTGTRSRYCLGTPKYK